MLSGWWSKTHRSPAKVRNSLWRCQQWPIWVRRGSNIQRAVPISMLVTLVFPPFASKPPITSRSSTNIFLPYQEICYGNQPIWLEYQSLLDTPLWNQATTPKTAKPNWSHSPRSRLEWFWTSLSQNYHQLSLILLLLAKFLLYEHHNGIHWLASEKEIFSSTPPRRRQTTRGIHETTGHRQKMERLSAQIWYYKGNEWQCGNALWEYNFEWECRDEEGCRRHES